MEKNCKCSHWFGGEDNLQMEKIVNAVTSIEQEIIYKCEKKEMRSQV